MQKAQLTAIGKEHRQHCMAAYQPEPAYSELGDSFTPSEGMGKQYRQALGRFSTGVALVTANSSDGPIGMTINSFSSVSLDPALVLWSVANKSGRASVFTEASHFAIHVLAEDQYQAAMDFTSNAQAFSDDDWLIGEDKIPLSQSALARFECQHEALFDAGDHTIIVGRVLRFSQRSGNPLVFNAGEFGTFAPGLFV